MNSSRYQIWIGVLVTVFALQQTGQPQAALADEQPQLLTASRLADDGPAQPALDADGRLVAAEVTKLTTAELQPESTCSTARDCIQITRTNATRPVRDTAAERVAAAGDVSIASSTPDYCWAWAAGTTSYEWRALDRKAGCFHGRYNIIVHNTKGEIVGRSFLDIAIRSASQPGQAGWNFSVDVSVWGVTGIGDPSVISLKTKPFSGVGAKTGVSSWSRPATLYWFGATYLERPNLALRQIQKDVGSFWYFTIGRSTGWAHTRTQTVVGSDSRCDQYSRSYYGCVYPKQPGRITYRSASYPTFAKHLKAAIKSGLKGGVGTGTYLSRITSAASVAKNGATACGSAKVRRMRPKGTQCDEYPFRSTKQGAWTSGTPVARTFNWCHMPDKKRTGKKGFSRCFITSGDNTGAGGKLGAFYKNQHILNGDKFQVAFL